MVWTRKHAPIPEGMALVETAGGRWFPAFALFSDIPDRIDMLEISPLIPPARDSLHVSGQGYVCREEAIEACRSWYEAVALAEYWRGLAARTELYPERNAWYLDEIEHLAGGVDTVQVHCGVSVQAMVLVRDYDHSEVITATGDTPDEAIETLYQRVYDWSRKL